MWFGGCLYRYCPLINLLQTIAKLSYIPGCWKTPINYLKFGFLLLNCIVFYFIWFLFQKALSRYDFEFYAWPVEFKWSDIEGWVFVFWNCIKYFQIFSNLRTWNVKFYMQYLKWTFCRIFWRYMSWCAYVRAVLLGN